MEAIVYNHTQTKIPLLMESLCLRTAYILCDYATLAGSSYTVLLFDRIYNPKRLEDKIEMVDQYTKSEGEEFLGEMNEVRRMLKLFNKVKHHSAEGISKKKQFEKSVDQMFNVIKAERLRELQKTGLPQLQPLYDKGEFGLFPVDIITHESDQGDDIPASELLQLNLPEENYSPPLFFLSTDFFLEDFIDPWTVVEARDSRASKPENIYIEHCFSVPNLNLLTSTELETIHTQLAPAAAPFWKKMDEWITLSHDEASAAETRNFFIKEVRPTIAPLLAAIAENELLQHCSKLQDDRVIVEVFLGELPVEAIWKYYRYFGVMTDETWQKLMDAKENDPSLSGRWPVMLLRIPAIDNIETAEGKEVEDIVDEEPNREETVLPVKKSINID